MAPVLPFLVGQPVPSGRGKPVPNWDNGGQDAGSWHQVWDANPGVQQRSDGRAGNPKEGCGGKPKLRRFVRRLVMVGLSWPGALGHPLHGFPPRHGVLMARDDPPTGGAWDLDLFCPERAQRPHDGSVRPRDWESRV